MTVARVQPNAKSIDASFCLLWLLYWGTIHRPCRKTYCIFVRSTFLHRADAESGSSLLVKEETSVGEQRIC